MSLSPQCQGQSLLPRSTKIQVPGNTASGSAWSKPRCRGPGKKEGVLQVSPSPVPLEQSHSTWIFLLREGVKFPQKDKTSPVALVLVLAGALFGVIHHQWKVSNDILP